MFGVGWTEILVILVVALLVLGPNKLPEIAKGLGKGIRDFRKAMSSLEDDGASPPPSQRATQAAQATQASHLPPADAAAPAPPPPAALQAGPQADGPATATPAEPVPTEQTVSGRNPA